MPRMNLDTYFMNIAKVVSARSTCPRLSVGAVLTRGPHIIATGYNGSPPGAIHCIDQGCLMHEGHCIATVHAEINALLQAAMNATSTIATSMYITHQPCLNCLKTIISAGIHNIYYNELYNNIALSYESLRLDMTKISIKQVSL